MKKLNRKKANPSLPSRQIAEELFECVWPFCEIGAWRLFFWISRLLFPITLDFRYDFIKLLITFFLLYFIFLEKGLQYVTQKANNLNSRQQITVLRFCNKFPYTRNLLLWLFANFISGINNRRVNFVNTNTIIMTWQRNFVKYNSIPGKQQLILDLWVFHELALIDMWWTSGSQIQRLTMFWSNTTRTLQVKTECNCFTKPKQNFLSG